MLILYWYSWFIFYSYFWPIFANFQNEVYSLSINSLTDRGPKWLFFMLWFNFKFFLSNLSHIYKINAVVTVLWVIKRVYYFCDSPGIIYIYILSKFFSVLVDHVSFRIRMNHISLLNFISEIPLITWEQIYWIPNICLFKTCCWIR